LEFLFKLKTVLTGKGNLPLEEIINEKRFSPRIQCEVQATCTFAGGEEYSTVVSEIGLYGIRIHMPRELKEGQMVKVTAIKGIGILAGARYSSNSIKMKVIWSKRRKMGRDHMSGLQFTDTKKSLRDSWVAFLLKKYGIIVGLSSQRRKKIRLPASLPLSFSRPGEQERFPGTMLDIGLGGMLAAMEKGVGKDEVLQFYVGPYKYFPLLSINGKILHVRFVPSMGKWVAGVIFESPGETETKLLNSYLTHLYFDRVDGRDSGKFLPAY
jgi:hypothetical protein